MYLKAHITFFSILDVRGPFDSLSVANDVWSNGNCQTLHTSVLFIVVMATLYPGFNSIYLKALMTFFSILDVRGPFDSLSVANDVWSNGNCQTLHTSVLFIVVMATLYPGFNSIYLWSNGNCQTLHTSVLFIVVMATLYPGFNSIYLWSNGNCQTLHTSVLFIVVMATLYPGFNSIYLWSNGNCQTLHTSVLFIVVMATLYPGFNSIYLWSNGNCQTLHTSVLFIVVMATLYPGFNSIYLKALMTFFSILDVRGPFHSLSVAHDVWSNGNSQTLHTSVLFIVVMATLFGGAESGRMVHLSPTYSPNHTFFQNRVRLVAVPKLMNQVCSTIFQ